MTEAIGRQEHISRTGFDMKTRQLLYTIGELYSYTPTDEAAV